VAEAPAKKSKGKAAAAPAPAPEEAQQQLASSSSKPLAGKILVFSGTLSTNRKKATAMAQGAGAKVTGDVSGSTTHLVAGPGAGTKVDKAEAKGVTIWTEDDFLAAVGGGGGDGGGGGGKAKAAPAPKAAGKRKANTVDDEDDDDEGKGESAAKKMKGQMNKMKTDVAAKGKGKAAQALDTLVVCVSGQMSMVRKQFWDWLRSHGATVNQSGVTRDTTHLITTAAEADNPTNKVLEAMRRGTLVVSEDFVQEAVRLGALPDVTAYLLIDPADQEQGASKSKPRNAKAAAAAADRSDDRSAVAPGRAMQATLLAAKGGGKLVTVTTSAKSAAAARQVMLADKYDAKKVDPTGWLMSEKLDGVRAYWDGANFYSRNGNAFPAPLWFKEGLPSTPLDGELWAGRRQFRRCLSIVRSGTSGDLWQYITYLVFDAPALDKPYEQRLAYIQGCIGRVAGTGSDGASSAAAGADVSAAAGTPYAAPVGAITCTGRAHVSAELAKVEAQGGEGLMLRRPGSKYEHTRSKNLLKVKNQKDEEAIVRAHEGGAGKNSFRTGALPRELGRKLIP
jgi:ATP-dependent DNA ligase